MTEYVAHLRDDARALATACGEPWQGWQAPERIDPYSIVLPPHQQPQRGTKIRQCQACARAALAETEHTT